MRNNTLQADNGTNKRYAKAYRKTLQSKPVKKTFVDRVKDEVNNYRDMRRTVDAQINEFATQAIKSGLGGGIAHSLRERATMKRATRTYNPGGNIPENLRTHAPSSWLKKELASAPMSDQINNRRKSPNVTTQRRAVANPRPTQRQSSRKTGSYR